jgi:adenylosuccinate lyase
VQRDRHANFVQTVALVAASLEKFAVEIRSLQRTEIDELGEPFAEGQTGSSAMPHKRNPELSERICGLARLIRGHSVVALDNVALWNERDISHSSAERMILPDSCLALDYMLDVFTSIVKDLRVNSNAMTRNMEASHGLVFSQRVLVALIDKGLSRESAYSMVQNNAKLAWDGDQDFRSALLNDVDIRKSLSEQEIDELFDYKYYLRHIDYIFNRLELK